MSETWTWRKSTRSVANGECVEISRPDVPVVGLRDSKAPCAGHLRVPNESFDAFLTMINVDPA
jgi:hypothetical protein